MLTDYQGYAQAEAHHRFFNALTTLGGLLRQDFARFNDPLVRDAVATFEAQLTAVAGIQQSLQASALAGALDAPAHFSRLSAQLAALLLSPRGIVCEFSGDEGEMDPGVAEKLGLNIAELVTNAAKHAFPGRTHGRVAIGLRRLDDGWTCAVGDDGIGLGAGSRGAGLRLVEILARGIGGTVTTASNDAGATVVVRFPLPPARPAPDAELRWAGTGLCRAVEAGQTHGSQP
jgi:two-component sensor histidine kinase